MYTPIMCYLLELYLNTQEVYAAMQFVHKIYKNIHNSLKFKNEEALAPV